MKKPSLSCDSLRPGHSGMLFCPQTSHLSYWVLLLCIEWHGPLSPPPDSNDRQFGWKLGNIFYILHNINIPAFPPLGDLVHVEY